MSDRDAFEHLRQLFASAREALRPILPKRLRGDTPVVPVVRLSGVIGFATPLRSALTLAAVARPLERAFGMRRARAVALVINSPGGSPVQSHLIYRRIRELAAENSRPVIAFAEDVAASGGYMIACAADEIVCDPSSIVGSIGVVGGSFGFAKLMDKLGIERRLYTSGDQKAMLDPFLPEKPEDVERLKSVQREIHEGFIELVKRSRGARLKGQEKTLFSGEYWTGSKAIELGLADTIGDLRTTLRARFGDDVVTPLVSPARGWFGRVQPGVGRAGFDVSLRGGDLAEEIVSALEARALWARYGL
ncbi:MAG TPA: S49 family peptidase [Xanthobacteraceae bacterium]